MIGCVRMNEILRRHSFSIAFLTLVLGGIFLLPESSGTIERFSGFTMGTSTLVLVSTHGDNQGVWHAYIGMVFTLDCSLGETQGCHLYNMILCMGYHSYHLFASKKTHPCTRFRRFQHPQT